MQTHSYLRSAVRFILICLAVLMPLFFLSYTLEVIELNKHFLLYAGTLIALMLWFLEGALTRSFKIVRSAFDVYVLGFFAVVFISGLLSVDRGLSFVGNYNNVQIGIVPLLFLLLYAFLITQVFETSRDRLRVVFGFALGGALSAVWFLLDKFGILTYAMFSARMTNSVAMANSEFGTFLAVMVIGCVALLSLKKKNVVMDVLAGITAFVSLAALVSLGFTIVYILLVVGLAVLLSFMLTFVDFLRIQWIIATFVLVIVAVLFIFLGAPRFFQFSLPVEVSLGVSTSYEIAWDALTDNTKQFLLGSGPSTFLYDFSQYRPENLNLNAFAWRARFSRPYATFAALLAEVGVLGVVSFLFLLLIVFGFVGHRWLQAMGGKKGKAQFSERIAFVYLIAPLWIMIVVSFFFLYASMTLWFTWFAMLAMLSAALVKDGRVEYIDISLKSSPQYVLATSFTVVLFFAGGIVFAVFAGRYYAAEVLYGRAQVGANSPSAQISMISQAISLNQGNARYRVALAQAFLNEARIVAGQADASPDLVSRLVSNAIDQAKAATEAQPRNVNTWETLAQMYANASSFAPGVNVWVTRSYEKAVAYEPTNPILRLQLGKAYVAEGKFSEALDEFQESVSLKPDYLEAYLQLAQYYEGQDDISQAIAELERGLSVGRQSDVYLFQLGRLYFNRGEEGDWDRALLLFNASLAINPNNINSLFSTGVVFDRRGERETALRLFEEVLKRDPSHEAVQSRVKQLRSILGIQ